MTVIHRQHHISTEGVTTSETDDGPPSARHSSRALAVLRIAFGFTFLWAFLDKTFALGFSTGPYAEDGPARTDFGPTPPGSTAAARPRASCSFGVPADNPFNGLLQLPRRPALGRLALHARPARHRRDPPAGGRACGSAPRPAR